MATTSDSVVLGLDITKTKKAISEDLKKVLKGIKPEALNLTDVDTSKITQTITEAIEKAYKETAARLPTLDVALNVADSSINSIEQSIGSFQKLLDNLNLKVDDNTLITLILSELKEALSQLLQIDTVLTNLNQSSAVSMSQLKHLQTNAFDTASKYGKTATAYINNIQQMSKAGFQAPDQMAELSLLAQSAGNISEALSNSYLLASNSSYNLKGNVKELQNVLDGQVAITSQSRLQMEDMAAATLEAASSASNYGIKISELSALIAAVASTTHDSGDNIGKELQNLFFTLQDSSNQSIVDAFHSVGISMTKVVNDTRQLKSPIELLKELSTVYKELPQDAPEKSTILTAIGNNSSTLSAILSDWKSYEEMLLVYSQGEGAATRKAEDNANTLEGSLNRLQNSWVELAQTFCDTEGLTSVIHLFNDFVNGSQELLDTVGVLPLAIGSVVTVLQNKSKSGGLIRWFLSTASPFLATVEFSSDAYEFHSKQGL